MVLARRLGTWQHFSTTNKNWNLLGKKNNCAIFFFKDHYLLHTDNFHLEIKMMRQKLRQHEKPIVRKSLKQIRLDASLKQLGINIDTPNPDTSNLKEKDVIENDVYQLAKVKDNAGSHESVRHFLKTIGIKTYLESKIGGSKGQREIEQQVGQIAFGLTWTYCRHHKSSRQLADNLEDTIDWYVKLIETEYPLLLSEYCSYLELEERKVGSILNCLTSLDRGAKWVVHHLRHKRYQPNPAVLNGWQDGIKCIKNSYRGAKRAEAAACATTREAVLQMKQPPGGIRALQDMVLEKSDEFLVQHYQHTTCLNVTEDIYRINLQLLFSGCYTFAIQGRQSGIEDMKKEDYPELMGYGHAMSDNFKTARVYGYQPVTLATEQMPHMIKAWEWRDVAVRNGGQDSVYLFLDWNGRPLRSKVGVYVRQFFRQPPLSLRVTTTEIRKMTATKAYKLHKEGDIQKRT
jgi:hypothetical protein